MNIIGIDTSTKMLDMVITDGKDLILNVLLSGKERTSKNIIVVLKQLLERGGLTLSDIEGVAVIKGPGSFTGLKLGMTLAKILAYFLDIPILGTDLFEVIGFRYRYMDEDIDILIPSRKKEFYYGRYLKRKGVEKYSVIREEEFSRYLSKNIWIYAPYPDVEKILRESGYTKIIPGWKFFSKAYTAALLGQENFQIKREDPYTISPLYIRKFPF